MASESIACNGFYTEHGNSVINNYFPQLNGTNNGNNNVPTGGNINSSGINSSTNNVNSGTLSGGGGGASNNTAVTPVTTTGTGRQSTGSNSSTTSTSQWTNLSSPTSSSSPSQQQQQQQQRQAHQTPQTPQTQQPQHRSHHHHQQQQHHTHHHQQQQQQQPQQQDHLVQNIPTTSNAHSIFGGGFHHRTNNPWGLQNLAACYQRMQQHNENAYAQNFHSVTLANGPLNSNNSDTSNSNLIAHQQQQQQQLFHHQQQHHQNQQNFKRFGLYSGKSGNSKDICGDDKFKEDGDPWNVEAQAAFLGPNLWDKTLPYDADLKVTQYADLDEFLSENNIPDGLPGTHLGHSTSLGHRSDSLGHSTSLSLGLGHITTKRERSPSPSDCVSPDTINPPSPAESTFSFASSGRDFDPRTRAFSDEELKPQPMIKKSRKQFVPDELKDDKYWARRRKNNIAAKRSRDARRQKENQIAMRARYLEKENSTLHQEVEQLKQENMELRARLSKYQEV